MSKRARVVASDPETEDELPVCPYLDTVNPKALDLDQELVCAVTMSRVGVHACLVCGKLLQGRGSGTPASRHSLEMGHHVFLEVDTGRVWCLPDGYEVKDSSLDRVVSAVKPKFTAESIRRLDEDGTLSEDVMGEPFLAGCVGLNNVGATDSLSSVIQILLRVKPLRDYFLVPPPGLSENSSRVVGAFGSLLRRICNRDALRATVSPHALAGAIRDATDGKLCGEKPVEVSRLMSWLLHRLHRDLLFAYPEDSEARQSAEAAERGHRTDQKRVGRWRAAGGKGEDRSIVTECFGGVVQIRVWRGGGPLNDENAQTSSVPFNFLTLDPPSAPLFRDAEQEQVTIPKVPLLQLLEKFNGTMITESTGRAGRERRTYRLIRAPPYLLFHVRRFTFNARFTEKNPTLVTLPLRNLDLAALLPPPPPMPESIPALRRMCAIEDVDIRGVAEKEDLVTHATQAYNKAYSPKYDLVASVVHDPPKEGGQSAERSLLQTGAVKSAAEAAAAATGRIDPLQYGHYRSFVYHDGAKAWFEVDDLAVRPAVATMVAASAESSIALFRREF